MYRSYSQSVSSECFKRFVAYLSMASGNKNFRIKINHKQEIDQVILKLGSQQCFNANDDIVKYLNNYATEMFAGFYLNQDVEQSEKIAQIIALMGAQVSLRFSVSILIFIFVNENNLIISITLPIKSAVLWKFLIFFFIVQTVWRKRDFLFCL